jgi:hydroxyquinol 1,2-dioxygenase
MCDDKRQEFILLSDVLGLPMLTVAMNNDKPARCPQATVFGPFHVEGAPRHVNGDDAIGTTCRVWSTAKGLNGEPVAGAVIEVWQADAQGNHDAQYPGLDKAQARGVLKSGPNGSVHFKMIVADSYAIPVEGRVDELRRANGRHPRRPLHLHLMIKAPGYETHGHPCVSQRRSAPRFRRGVWRSRITDGGLAAAT